MNDKKHRNKQISNEDESDYLRRTNVTTEITNAVETLLQNRPQDPIQFLIDLFAPCSGTYSVDSACEKLSRAHYSCPVYQRNALQVYDVLMTCDNQHTQLKGLLGQRFNSLLEKMSACLPNDYPSLVMQRMRKRDNHVISFNTFYRDVLLIHVLKDFIDSVNEMFNDLDVHATGKASQYLCDHVVECLFGSSKEGECIGVDKTFTKLFIKNADSSFDSTAESMLKEEFLRICVLKFLENH